MSKLMLLSSRWLPLSLIFIGVLLMGTAVAVPLLPQMQPDPMAAPLPKVLAGLPQASRMTGSPALRDIVRLHGKSFPVRSGAKAIYGAESQATLWVAGTDSASSAHSLLVEMHDKIADGNSPFQATGSRTYEGQEVYALQGMGQAHFYFQSGVYLVWLSVDGSLGELALKQALDYYRSLD